MDTDGKAIAAKDLAKLLEKETPVVIFAEGAKPKPEELKLVKKGTVIPIIPVSLFGGYGTPV